MKRKTIISLIFSLLAIALLSVSVYASYSFVRSIINDEVEAGKISYNVKNDFAMYYTGTGANDDLLSDAEKISIPDDKKPLESDSSIEGYSPSTRILTCYATKKLGFSDEKNYIYLNQLGFTFRYKAQMNTMLRISVKSSWISHKVYSNGTVVENVVTKDKKINELFSISNDYYIDNDAEYIYYKSVIETCDVYTQFQFDCDSNYYFTLSSTSSYREYIIVNITFDVDIVQANRALAKWNLGKFPW